MLAIGSPCLGVCTHCDPIMSLPDGGGVMNSLCWRRRCRGGSWAAGSRSRRRRCIRVVAAARSRRRPRRRGRDRHLSRRRAAHRLLARALGGVRVRLLPRAILGARRRRVPSLSATAQTAGGAAAATTPCHRTTSHAPPPRRRPGAAPLVCPWRARGAFLSVERGAFVS
jgi:hypothetical protein